MFCDLGNFPNWQNLLNKNEGKGRVLDSLFGEISGVEFASKTRALLDAEESAELELSLIDSSGFSPKFRQMILGERCQKKI